MDNLTQVESVEVELSIEQVGEALDDAIFQTGGEKLLPLLAERKAVLEAQLGFIFGKDPEGVNSGDSKSRIERFMGLLLSFEEVVALPEGQKFLEILYRLLYEAANEEPPIDVIKGKIENIKKQNEMKGSITSSLVLMAQRGEDYGLAVAKFIKVHNVNITRIVLLSFQEDGSLNLEKIIGNIESAEFFKRFHIEDEYLMNEEWIISGYGFLLTLVDLLGELSDQQERENAKALVLRLQQGKMQEVAMYSAQFDKVRKVTTDPNLFKVAIREYNKDRERKIKEKKANTAELATIKVSEGKSGAKEATRVTSSAEVTPSGITSSGESTTKIISAKGSKRAIIAVTAAAIGLILGVVRETFRSDQDLQPQVALALSENPSSPVPTASASVSSQMNAALVNNTTPEASATASVDADGGVPAPPIDAGDAGTNGSEAPPRKVFPQKIINQPPNTSRKTNDSPQVKAPNPKKTDRIED